MEERTDEQSSSLKYETKWSIKVLSVTIMVAIFTAVRAWNEVLNGVTFSKPRGDPISLSDEQALRESIAARTVIFLRTGEFSDKPESHV